MISGIFCLLFLSSLPNTSANPLHIAASRGYKSVVNLLIEQGADVNAKDKYGQMPLHFAANRASMDLAQLLIDNGADVNAKNMQGHTPLYSAATQYVSRDVIKFLIDKGADVHTGTKTGRTPPHKAAFGKNIKDDSTVDRARR